MQKEMDTGLVFLGAFWADRSVRPFNAVQMRQILSETIYP